jgi:hypothetical protein
LVIFPGAQGWTPPAKSTRRIVAVEQRSWSAGPLDAGDYKQPIAANAVSRRNLLHTAFLIGATALVAGVVAVPAGAAAELPSAKELERLQQGHARVRYLLDNWNAVTEICGTTVMSDTERRQVIRTEGGTQCTKTPLRVQEFLGYKSVTDPLYRADKLMVRAGALVDPDDFENYLDAVERYREKADQSSLLAYTSSWGEANPNGSKEVIEDYLEQTKMQVVESERLLKQVLNYLKLPTLPPLQGKL